MSYLKGSFLDESPEILKILNVKKMEDFKMDNYSSLIYKLFSELSLGSNNYNLPLWGMGPHGTISKQNNRIISKSIQTRYDSGIRNIVFHIRELFNRSDVGLTKEVSNELVIIELLTLAISIESYINFCLQKIEADWNLFQKEESYVDYYKNYKKSTCKKFKNKKCINWRYSNTITNLFFIIELVSSKDFDSEQEFKPVIDLIEFRNEIVHIKNRKIEE